MKHNSSFGLFVLIFTCAIPSAVSAAAERQIYHCQNNNLSDYSAENNPDGIQKIGLSIFESHKVIANRPEVFATVTLVKKNGENDSFYMPLVGIPEFLGSNMFHAFFTGRFTSYAGYDYRDFSLKSWFSKSGAQRAILSINTRAFPREGFSFLNDIPVLCEVMNTSIYLD